MIKIKLKRCSLKNENLMHAQVPFRRPKCTPGFRANFLSTTSHPKPANRVTHCRVYTFWSNQRLQPTFQNIFRRFFRLIFFVTNRLFCGNF